MEFLFKKLVLLKALYDSDSSIPIEEFDAEVEDTGAQFSMLMTVLEHFPNQVSWKGNDLRRMVLEIQAAQKAERRRQKAEGIWQ